MAIGIEQLVSHWGYWAVGIGTFFEGETVLVVGGIAAHQGWLKLEWVVLCAFVGSVLGDQLYFQIGRYYGQRLIDARPGWKAGTAKVLDLVERHQVLFILSFRFLYGLRTVSPFAIGISRVTTLRFTLLQMVAAAIWAVVLGWAGFAFGAAVEVFLSKLQHNVLVGAMILGAVSVAYAALHFLLGRRRRVRRLRTLRRQRAERDARRRQDGGDGDAP